MAFTDYGPEILFRTPHSVFSIPNHRHQPGFTATYSAMTAKTPAARQILDHNAVDAVLVCTDDVERAFYGAATDSFHTQLANGDAPDWLHEVPVPGGRPPASRASDPAAASSTDRACAIGRPSRFRRILDAECRQRLLLGRRRYYRPRRPP